MGLCVHGSTGHAFHDMAWHTQGDKRQKTKEVARLGGSARYSDRGSSLYASHSQAGAGVQRDGPGQGDIMDGGLVTAMHGDTREAKHTSWLRQEDWQRSPRMDV